METGNPRPDRLDCVATCRPGLEGVLLEEITALGGRQAVRGKRSVRFSCDKAGLYRMNLGLRTAIQVLLPIRTFNARDYQLLYYQARRTNWHHYFSVEGTLRIDVNGHSNQLRNTQYVVHRVKDGIVDTFRKLTEGRRPSVEKRNPDIHVVVHLDGQRVTLCLDSSGVPLFKRGYRAEHTEAPIKEDLAAGILLLSGLSEGKGLMDPVCGSGTFLFEGWMILANQAPNLNRSFAFQNWRDFDEPLFQRERAALAAGVRLDGGWRCRGCEISPQAAGLAEAIRQRHFPEADIRIENQPFQDCTHALPGALMAANPPYGERLGSEEDLGRLYRELGMAARRLVPGGRLAVFTTNRPAARQIPLKGEPALTLYNGSLEGLLFRYTVHQREPGTSLPGPSGKSG